VAVAGRIVARSDVFAQANLSHLGETCRTRPKFTLELSLRRRALVLSKVLSAQAKRARLSENAGEPEARRCSCSPGEEPHLWARGDLAQARRARLNKNS